MLSAKPSKVSLIGWGALLFSLSFLPFGASAQSQGDNASVADAARRAREQKRAASKPARTLTNDDLPAAPAQPVVAPTGAAEIPDADQAQASGESTLPAKASPAVRPVGEPDAKRATQEAALQRAKADLAEAQGQLDVLQRKAALDSDIFYSKTGYASDSEGKARLDAEAQQINDKKSQVDDLKAKVVALEAELGQAAEPEKPAQPL